jgi:hypothetical protein
MALRHTGQRVRAPVRQNLWYSLLNEAAQWAGMAWLIEHIAARLRRDAQYTDLTDQQRDSISTTAALLDYLLDAVRFVLQESWHICRDIEQRSWGQRHEYIIPYELLNSSHLTARIRPVIFRMLAEDRQQVLRRKYEANFYKQLRQRDIWRKRLISRTAAVDCELDEARRRRHLPAAATAVPLQSYVGARLAHLMSNSPASQAMEHVASYLAADGMVCMYVANWWRNLGKFVDSHGSEVHDRSSLKRRWMHILRSQQSTFRLAPDLFHVPEPALVVAVRTSVVADDVVVVMRVMDDMDRLGVAPWSPELQETAQAAYGPGDDPGPVVIHAEVPIAVPIPVAEPVVIAQPVD